jgi:hypothetical protein
LAFLLLFALAAGAFVAPAAAQTSQTITFGVHAIRSRGATHCTSGLKHEFYMTFSGGGPYRQPAECHWVGREFVLRVRINLLTSQPVCPARHFEDSSWLRILGITGNSTELIALLGIDVEAELSIAPHIMP